MVYAYVYVSSIVTLAAYSCGTHFLTYVVERSSEDKYAFIICNPEEVGYHARTYVDEFPKVKVCRVILIGFNVLQSLPNMRLGDIPEAKILDTNLWYRLLKLLAHKDGSNTRQQVSSGLPNEIRGVRWMSLNFPSDGARCSFFSNVHKLYEVLLPFLTGNLQAFESIQKSVSEGKGGDFKTPQRSNSGCVFCFVPFMLLSLL
jgi:hypothetical protein